MILEGFQPRVHIGVFPGSLGRRRENDHAVDMESRRPRGPRCLFRGKCFDKVPRPVRPPFRRVEDEIFPNGGFEVLIQLSAGAPESAKIVFRVDLAEC